MNPLLGKALLRVVLFYAYGLLVAWIFTFIEEKEELAHHKMERMLSELKKEVHMKYNMTDKEFNSFVRRATAAMAAGNQKDWNFVNSCGFVFSAITTIGYGLITPKTQVGQGVTIIICIIGIPITMLALKTSGEVLAGCFRVLVVKTETGIFKRTETKHLKKKTFFVACTLMVILVLLASLSSTYFEEWSFMEGLYAWFITFTTIGFGDYVQFETHSKKITHGNSSTAHLFLHGIIFAVPYVVGLSLMSCILTCLVDSVDHLRDFRDRCMNCCLGLTGFFSLLRNLFQGRKSSYDVTEEPVRERNELN